MTTPSHLDSVGREGASDTSETVVLCHGRGQDETSLTDVTARLPEAVAPVRVRAPHVDGSGYRWYDTALSNGSHDLSQPRTGEFRESLDLLHGFCDDLADTPVGLVGYSQGAMIALAAVIERPSLYRWVGALHGYLPASHSSPALVRRAADTPTFVGYGERDEAIPCWRSRRAVATLVAGGTPVTERSYDSGHALSNPELDDVASWIDDVSKSSSRRQ